MFLSEYFEILLDYSKLLSEYLEFPRLFLKSDAKVQQIILAFSLTSVTFRNLPLTSTNFR